MLANIKLLLGLTDTSKDSLLTLLITMVTEEVQSYIHDDDVSELSNVISQIVIYRYNRLGTEGVDSEDYSGVSYNYTDDYPDSIIRQLKAHRKVRVIQND